jgi:hypothetical protein
MSRTRQDQEVLFWLKQEKITLWEVCMVVSRFSLKTGDDERWYEWYHCEVREEMKIYCESTDDVKT